MSMTMTPKGAPHRGRLHDLAARMRHAVVQATQARDLAAKVAFWDEYREARSEVLLLSATEPDTP